MNSECIFQDVSEEKKQKLQTPTSWLLQTLITILCDKTWIKSLLHLKTSNTSLYSEKWHLTACAIEWVWKAIFSVVTKYFT
jgi:hypothetical protein